MNERSRKDEANCESSDVCWVTMKEKWGEIRWINDWLAKTDEAYKASSESVNKVKVTLHLLFFQSLESSFSLEYEWNCKASLQRQVEGIEVLLQVWAICS